MKKSLAALTALALFLSVTGVSFASTVLTDGVSSKAKVSAEEKKEEGKKKKIEGC
ncbi:MAG: hypothetical protein ACOY3Z_01020 [Thermodesulfobacteriota bacterium]